MGRRRRLYFRTESLLRALTRTLRLERLRQLWMQCDMFEASSVRGAPQGHEFPRVEIARPAPPHPEIKIVRLKRRTSKERASEQAIIDRLQVAYAEYNEQLFSGELRSIRMRLSRRMKNRLGHYMVAGGGQPAEIAMSLRHIERDPWDDVLHTLVHEMVHQWQDQHGMALDHGHTFRAKALEIGISARATRPARGSVQPRLAARTGRRGRS